MVSTCDICQRTFDSLKGLKIHRSSCQKKEKVIIKHVDCVHNENNYDFVSVAIETATIVETSEIPI